MLSPGMSANCAQTEHELGEIGGHTRRIMSNIVNSMPKHKTDESKKASGGGGANGLMRRRVRRDSEPAGAK